MIILSNEKFLLLSLLSLTVLISSFFKLIRYSSGGIEIIEQYENKTAEVCFNGHKDNKNIFLWMNTEANKDNIKNLVKQNTCMRFVLGDDNRPGIDLKNPCTKINHGLIGAAAKVQHKTCRWDDELLSFISRDFKPCFTEAAGIELKKCYCAAKMKAAGLADERPSYFILLSNFIGFVDAFSILVFVTLIAYVFTEAGVEF
jgi:hypothetical protein